VKVINGIPVENNVTTNAPKISLVFVYRGVKSDTTTSAIITPITIIYFKKSKTKLENHYIYGFIPESINIFFMPDCFSCKIKLIMPIEIIVNAIAIKTQKTLVRAPDILFFSLLV